MPSGFESRRMGSKKPAAARATGFSDSVVPPAGCPRAAGAARFRCVAPLLACCAGKRFAFPQLRTLVGSNPMKWAQAKTVPFRGPFPNQWWAMRDVACGWRRPLSLRACGPRVLRWAQTKTVPFRGPFPNRWWAMRDSNPQPCACKAPALTVAPIARAERV